MPAFDSCNSKKKSFFFSFLKVDLYLLIKGKASRSKTSQKAKMQKMLYHVYGWGFPAFFTILGLAFRRLGATPGFSFFHKCIFIYNNTEKFKFMVHLICMTREKEKKLELG